MKLRNQKSVPFLGKNLPKRSRKIVNQNNDEPSPAVDHDNDSIQFNEVPDLEDVPTTLFDDENFLQYDEHFPKESTPLKKYARGSDLNSTRHTVNTSNEEQSDNEVKNLSFNFSQCKNQSDILEGILRDITNRSRNQDSDDGEELNQQVENSDVIEFLSMNEPETDESSSQDRENVRDPGASDQESLNDDESSHQLASRSIIEQLGMSVRRIRAILNGTNADDADGNDDANRTSGNSSCVLL